MGDWCATGKTGSDGRVDFTRSLFLRPRLGSDPDGMATSGEVAQLTFRAPASASISHVTYHRRLQSADQAWEVALRAAGANLETCRRQLGQYECLDPHGDGVFDSDVPTGSSTLSLSVACVDAPCLYNPFVAYDFAAVIYSSTVTVEENGAPQVGAPVVGGLVNGWFGAAGTLGFSGSDQLGLRRLEVVEGQRVVVTRPNGKCVDWSVLPCAETAVGASAGFAATATSVDLGLGDGEYAVRARATDAAGNQTLSAPVTLRVDRTAPVAESVSGGGISAAQTRTVDWTAPVGGSPVVGARVKLCSGPALACTFQAAPVEGPWSFDLPQDGALATVQVELTDQAGNIGRTSDVVFARDARAPAAPGLSVARADGAERTLAVTKADTDVVAYLVRVCKAAACTESRVEATGTVPLTLPGYGLYTVEVQLVDGAGNIGPAGAIGLDYQAPQQQPVPIPAPRKALALAVKTPKRLGKTSILVRGTVTAGSATRITVTLSGRRPGRKKDVTVSRSIKPSARGSWSVRVKLPTRISRRRGVLVTTRATPTAAYLEATTRKRIRG